MGIRIRISFRTREPSQSNLSNESYWPFSGQQPLDIVVGWTRGVGSLNRTVNTNPSKCIPVMGQAYLNLAVVLQARPSFPKMLPVISGNASSKIGNAHNCLCGPDLASYVVAEPSPIDIISASQILDARDFHQYGTYERSRLAFAFIATEGADSFHTGSMPPWKTVMPGAADTAGAPVASAKFDPATPWTCRRW
jgi:hypothetical protein